MLFSRFHRRVRRGLTLLELVVVLTILVAVGGLLVPLLPNFVHRSNIAACAVNIPEIDKMMQTYQTMYAEHPNRMDSVLLADGTIPSYVQVGTAADYGVCYAAHTLNAGEAAALTEVGITEVVDLAATGTGDWNPTFWPYSDSIDDPLVFRTLADGEAVLSLTEEGEKLMGLDDDVAPDGDVYVVFGLNVPCTLFRRLAAEPAYHFADTPAEDPASFYMCFAVLYKVSNVDGPLGEAVYKGCLAFHDFGPSTAGMHTREWWSRAKDERDSEL